MFFSGSTTDRQRKVSATGLAGLANQATGHAPATAAPPAELSLQLQAVLGQHSVLAADMMRGRLRSDPDLAQAANTALGRNTEDMSNIIGSLLGEQAKTEFAELWAEHVESLFNYARGLAANDQNVQNVARSEAVEYERDLVGFFASSSQDRLDRGTAEAGVKMHVDHLLHQADAYAAKDYAKADQIYREAYSHTFGLGKALASTLLPPADAAALNAPLWRLQSELGRLLGEHAALVIAGMRAGVADDGDFGAAAETVNGNTRDLAAAVDTLFGPAAAKSFQSLWADHVDHLMEYTAAAAKDDDAQRTVATAKLEAFEQQLASFLDTATSSRLPSATLAAALASHDEMLIRQVDAYAAKNYQEAHDLAYTTYQEMFVLAGQLADAFGSTVASRLPQGAAQTGRGGMAVVK